jgi:hypothetical protein
VGTTTVAKPIDTTEPFRLSAFYLITLHLVGLRQLQIPLSDMQGSQKMTFFSVNSGSIIFVEACIIVLSKHTTKQRNHHCRSHYRLQPNSNISTRPTLHVLYRRRIRAHTHRAIRFADTFAPCRSRAIVNVAPERIQVGDVVDAGIRSSTGVVWKNLGAGAALGHYCCAVGA